MWCTFSHVSYSVLWSVISVMYIQPCILHCIMKCYICDAPSAMYLRVYYEVLYLWCTFSHVSYSVLCLGCTFSHVSYSVLWSVISVMHLQSYISQWVIKWYICYAPLAMYHVVFYVCDAPSAMYLTEYYETLYLWCNFSHVSYSVLWSVLSVIHL